MVAEDLGTSGEGHEIISTLCIAGRIKGDGTVRVRCVGQGNVVE